MTGRPVRFCILTCFCSKQIHRVTGYTHQNDCSIAIATSLPLTLIGDVWYEPHQPQGAALLFVFPFEQHLHDYGHVQIMLKALLDMMEKADSLPHTSFQSYTSVYLYSSRTNHMRAMSRQMARDAEIALLTASAPWLRPAKSPRFACSTLPQDTADGRSCKDACIVGVSPEQAQEQETTDNVGLAVDDALEAGSVPLMVIVAIGAAGDGGRPVSEALCVT